jgi:hypothetical protein
MSASPKVPDNKAGDIAAKMRLAIDKAEAERIGNLCKHDWDHVHGCLAPANERKTVAISSRR